METSASPLQRAFNAFLLTMPPQQLEELLKYLQDRRAQENKQSSYSSKNTRPYSEFNADKNRAAAIPASSISGSSSSRGKRVPDAKRRPLNSFIAFRSYYSVMFPDITQKAKSGILRFLWQNNPFKAKWAILAKSYSIVRDDHNTEVSLDSFLGLNARFIGIIEPSRYLEVMGWQLHVDQQQQYTMARVKALTTTNEADISTKYSVNDIVKHCYATGYVSEENRKSKASHSGSAAVMSFAAHPTLVVYKNDSIRISGNPTIVTDVCKRNAAMEMSSPEQAEDVVSPDLSDLSTATNGTPPLDTEVAGINRPQFYPEPSTGNDFDLDNIQFPGWNEENTMFAYDAALHTPLMHYDPLYQDSLEAWDFSRFVDI